MTPAKVLVVMGFGRSCTSGVARALDGAGWPMGDDLLPAHESNPWGHYEDRAAVLLNDRILAHHGGAWDNPPPSLTGTALTTLDLALAAEVAAYVRARGSDQWGVKDPRITFTWPYWRTAFAEHPELEPILVMNRRDPQTAAASLARRDGIPAADALALVRRYQWQAARWMDAE